MPANAAYVLDGMWRYDKRMVLMQAAEVAADVAVPLATAVLPALAIGWLSQGLGLAGFAGRVMASFALYALLLGAKSYLTGRNSMQYVEIRIKRYFGMFNDIMAGCDLQTAESAALKKASSQASEAMSSNQRGLEGMMHRLPELCVAVAQVALYSLILGRLEWWIVGLLVALAAVKLACFGAVTRYERSNKDALVTNHMTRRYLDRTIREPAAGKDIRLYGLNGWLSAVYRRANDQRMAIIRRQNSFYMLYDTVGLLLQLGQDAACYIYLLRRVMAGMSAADFVLYLNIVSGYGAAFIRISDTLAQMQESSLDIDGLRSFFTRYHAAEVVTESSGGMPSQGMDIVFDHVSYRYAGSDHDVLHDVSFHIPAGSRYALVGINGAGKSTLVKLLCGLYHPTSGRILIDGQDLAAIPLPAHAAQLAVMFQTSHLIQATIAENIACLPDGQLDRRRVEKAAVSAGLGDMLAGLDKGLETFIGHDIDPAGITPSGGQTQDILLARALYKPARLLMLDEPTAALDPLAESRMYHRYQQLTAGQTSLFISHRLASTRFCDEIIFLEQGHIVEQGSHRQLIAAGRSYAAMYEVQSHYYRKEVTDDEAA